MLLQEAVAIQFHNVTFPIINYCFYYKKILYVNFLA